MKNHNKCETNIVTNIVTNNKYIGYNVIDYLNIKKSLLAQNTNMNYIIDEIKNNCNDNKIMKTIPYYNILQNNKIIYLTLNDQIKNNNILLTNINKILNDICFHEMEEDDIEVGLDYNTIKVKYCRNCELNDSECT